MKWSRGQRISAKVPSRLPGILFKVEGRIRYRRVAVEGEALPPWRVARALSLRAVSEKLTNVAERFAPQHVLLAERECCYELCDWRMVESESGVEFRARITLEISKGDVEKFDYFEGSRRQYLLQGEIAEDWIRLVRDRFLSDGDSARLWWLYLNLERDPGVSWGEFNDLSETIIDSQESAVGIAPTFGKIARELVERVNDEPGRVDQVIKLAKLLLTEFDWAEDSVRQLDHIQADYAPVSDENREEPAVPPGR